MRACVGTSWPGGGFGFDFGDEEVEARGRWGMRRRTPPRPPSGSRMPTGSGGESGCLQYDLGQVGKVKIATASFAHLNRRRKAIRLSYGTLSLVRGREI